MTTKEEYAACVLRFFKLEPINPNNMGATVTGSQGCYMGPTEYRAPGYLEGLNLSINAMDSGISKTWGWEVVYDFATLQRQSFDYQSLFPFGDFDFVSLGVSDSQYFGEVKGFRTSVNRRVSQRYDINEDYGGIFESYMFGGGMGINTGIGYFQSTTDPLIRGGVWYFGGSVGKGTTVVEYSYNNYTPWSYQGKGISPWNYVLGDESIDLGRLQSDILSGHDSPLLWFGGLTPGITEGYRAYQSSLAAKYVFAYQALRYQDVIGW